MLLQDSQFFFTFFPVFFSSLIEIQGDLVVAQILKLVGNLISVCIDLQSPSAHFQTKLDDQHHHKSDKVQIDDYT